MSQIIEFTDLSCTEGSADKVYHCAVKEVEGGFVVPYAYGRRGSTLATGFKTSAPVALEVARKEYNKLIKSKMGGGYVNNPGVSGDIFGVATGEAGVSSLPMETKTMSGHRPQLLNAIELHEVGLYIQSPAWGLQQKFDGERRAIKVSVSGINGINRKGQIIPLHPELSADVNKAARCCLIDGESIGSKLYAFDLLELDSADLRHLSYQDRYNLLAKFIEDGDLSSVELVKLAVTIAEKQALFNRVKLSGGEGVVLKKLNSVYSPDRPATGGDQLKAKFWETATVVVTGINATKRSIQVAATDCSGTVEVPVGNVTIPPNKEVPAVGDLVEVRYLYFFPQGSLYQPQYLYVRKDADRQDCDICKLKVVQEIKEAA